mmetsp:Transcript_84089/g.238552  ORF Transcript_84089/g.238552 Transcript_84089/m.238552 type:complete len:159 (+) Transcript_84089:134-610(+)
MNRLRSVRGSPIAPPTAQASACPVRGVWQPVAWQPQQHPPLSFFLVEAFFLVEVLSFFLPAVAAPAVIAAAVVAAPAVAAAAAGRVVAVGVGVATMAVGMGIEADDAMVRGWAIWYAGWAAFTYVGMAIVVEGPPYIGMAMETEPDVGMATVPGAAPT